MSFLCSLIYRLTEIFIDITVSFFFYIDDLISKVIWKSKEARIAKTTPKKKTNVWGRAQTIVIKDQGSMALTKGETDPGDRAQKPEINPPTHPPTQKCQLVFLKVAKAMHEETDSLLQMLLERLDFHMPK